MLRRLLPVLVAAGPLLAACGAERPVLVSKAAVDPGGAAVSAAPPSTVAEAEVVRGLLTATGVSVAVLAELESGYRVRTPCGAEAEVSWGTPLTGADVVLDPGHGGPVETGAVGPNGVAEGQLDLAVARATATELGRRGIDVALTRTADYQVPLQVRAQFADQLGASALVSIHHNAPDANPSDRPGTEVYVQDGVAESRRLGGLVWQHVVDALDDFGLTWTSAVDAGVLVALKDTGQQSYGMIRYPEIPAVLAELAYLSNPAEAELLATPEYRGAVSLALADAIEAWLRTEDPGAGFVEQPRTVTPSGLTGGVEACVDPVLE